MQYPQFQAQGWPIGSGIVESGNKLVVEARMKGSGMHWAEAHVNPMLALRNVICSDRWKQEWPKIEARLRQQARQRRSHLHRSRKVVPAEPAPPLVDDRILQYLTQRHEQENEPKKPKTNPWCKFKHGKALYQPSTPPKKSNTPDYCTLGYREVTQVRSGCALVGILKRAVMQQVSTGRRVGYRQAVHHRTRCRARVARFVIAEDHEFGVDAGFAVLDRRNSCEIIHLSKENISGKH